MCGAQLDCRSQGWHLPLRKKVVSGDVFSVSTRARKIDEIGSEVKVQFIWRVTAAEWDGSQLCYQTPYGHDTSIASKFLFLFLVILGSNFNPIVGFPTDSLRSGGADYQTIRKHRKALQPVKLNTGVLIPWPGVNFWLPNNTKVSDIGGVRVIKYRGVNSLTIYRVFRLRFKVPSSGDCFDYGLRCLLQGTANVSSTLNSKVNTGPPGYSATFFA
jgi:hypothetical protein